MFYCSECKEYVKEKDLLFDEDNNSFMCNICRGYVEYVGKSKEVILK